MIQFKEQKSKNEPNVRLADRKKSKSVQIRNKHTKNYKTCKVLMK